MSSLVVVWWRIPTMFSASVLTFLLAGDCLTTKSKSNLCYDRRPVSQSVLMSSTHLEPKTRFLLLSDSCRFVDVGRPLWREDGSVVHNCCWPSPAQPYLRPVNSSGNFAIWVLIQFLWWPLLCLLLTRSHWALSWSAEISLRLLWTCRSETNCLY
jgi:hypothetical protein